MTRKQLADNNGVNNALITQKFPQKKKKKPKNISIIFLKVQCFLRSNLITLKQLAVN